MNRRCVAACRLRHTLRRPPCRSGKADFIHTVIQKANDSLDNRSLAYARTACDNADIVLQSILYRRPLAWREVNIVMAVVLHNLDSIVDVLVICWNRIKRFCVSEFNQPFCNTDFAVIQFAIKHHFRVSNRCFHKAGIIWVIQNAIKRRLAECNVSMKRGGHILQELVNRITAIPCLVDFLHCVKGTELQTVRVILFDTRF